MPFALGQLEERSECSVGMVDCLVVDIFNDIFERTVAERQHSIFGLPFEAISCRLPIIR